MPDAWAGAGVNVTTASTKVRFDDNDANPVRGGGAYLDLSLDYSRMELTSGNPWLPSVCETTATFLRPGNLIYPQLLLSRTATDAVHLAEGMSELRRAGHGWWAGPANGHGWR